MTVKKIITRTLFFEICGLIIIVASCINELFNGIGMTHPMWNASYNWLPLLGTILLISFGGSVASVLSNYAANMFSIQTGHKIFKVQKYSARYKPSMSV